MASICKFLSTLLTSCGVCHIFSLALWLLLRSCSVSWINTNVGREIRACLGKVEAVDKGACCRRDAGLGMSLGPRTVSCPLCL